MNQNYEQIMAQLKESMTVIFHSRSSNEARRSLNGTECWVMEWKTNSWAGYPYNVAVCVMLIDQWRMTWLALDEFIIPSLPTFPSEHIPDFVI